MEWRNGIALIRLDYIKSHCVYFLHSGNELLYVGCTSDLYGRISTHTRNKTIPFDAIKYVTFKSRKEALDAEKNFIASLRPVYNNNSTIDTTIKLSNYQWKYRKPTLKRTKDVEILPD